jgi:hypothetical protein
MNVNLTKLISSAAAVLAVGSSAYAQQKAPMPTSSCCFEQGYEICNDKFPAAYNAAARIDVQCSWDVFATGSFIYWHVSQDAMDLGTTTVASLTLPAEFTFGSKVAVQNFEYKPGFKVGLGVDFDHDNWVAFAEYTWLHQTTNTSVSAPSGFEVVASDWFEFAFYQTPPVYTDVVSSKWKMNLDMVDAVLSRPYYQGRKLTILPFCGLRGAWIRQNMRVVGIGGVFSYNPDLVKVAHIHSQSWAVGPRAGLQAHWMLGCGFRMEGDVSGSLLYTRYTKVTSYQSNNTASPIGFYDYSTVRPMADMGLGFGWGSYFDRQNYHFDLVATYDFNVMWGQNMLRELMNVYIAGSAEQPGNLYLHGLTVTARFDF